MSQQQDNPQQGRRRYRYPPESEDWTAVEDMGERRRIQNRLAQRCFREKRRLITPDQDETMQVSSTTRSTQRENRTAAPPSTSRPNPSSQQMSDGFRAEPSQPESANGPGTNSLLRHELNDNLTRQPSINPDCLSFGDNDFHATFSPSTNVSLRARELGGSHSLGLPQGSEDIFPNTMDDDLMIPLGQSMSDPFDDFVALNGADEQRGNAGALAATDVASILHAPVHSRENNGNDTDDSSGKSALWLAIENGNTGTIRMLQQRDPEATTETFLGETVLHAAARLGMVDVVKELLIHQACHAIKSSRHGSNGHYPASPGTSSPNSLLHQCDGFGRTALHVAVEQNQEAVVKLLLQQTDVGLETRDHRGRTALHIAGSKGLTSVLILLLEKGANARSRLGSGSID